MQNKRIQLVDDDDGVLKALGFFLRHRGMQVLTSTSGQALLDNFTPDAQDCLVMDIRLPDMTGYEALDQLAKRGYEPPAVVITGHGNASTPLKSRKRPVAHVLFKPFDPDELYQAIRDELDSCASAS